MVSFAFKFNKRSSWIIPPPTPPPSSTPELLTFCLVVHARAVSQCCQLPQARPNITQCVPCNQRDIIFPARYLSDMIQFRSVSNHRTLHLFSAIFLTCSRPMRSWDSCDDLERGNDDYRIMTGWPLQRSHIGHYSCKMYKLRIIVNAHIQHHLSTALLHLMGQFQHDVITWHMMFDP